MKDGVDYVFTSAPEKIKMSGTRTLRHRALVADGGWHETVRVLFVAGDAAAAADPSLSHVDDRVAVAAGRKDDLDAMKGELAAQVRDAARFATFETALQDPNQLAVARLEIASSVDLSAAAATAVAAPAPTTSCATSSRGKAPAPVRPSSARTPG